MEFKSTPIQGLTVIQPQIFGDTRGYFMESYSFKKWKDAEKEYIFVQDNESLSKKGVLRGLHFQAPPFAQDKLVRVIKGAVLDVVVDIRKNSSTYGQHFSIELNEENKTQFFIPKGFAHGFVTLREDTIFTYKVSEFYHPESEMSILWNDTSLNIDWQVSTPLLSAKDLEGVKWTDFNSPF